MTKFGQCCCWPGADEAGVRFVTVNTFMTCSIVGYIYGSLPSFVEQCARTWLRCTISVYAYRGLGSGAAGKHAVCNLSEFAGRRINPAAAATIGPMLTIYFAGAE